MNSVGQRLKSRLDTLAGLQEKVRQLERHSKSGPTTSYTAAVAAVSNTDSCPAAEAASLANSTSPLIYASCLTSPCVDMEITMSKGPDLSPSSANGSSSDSSHSERRSTSGSSDLRLPALGSSFAACPLLHPMPPDDWGIAPSRRLLEPQLPFELSLDAAIPRNAGGFNHIWPDNPNFCAAEHDEVPSAINDTSHNGHTVSNLWESNAELWQDIARQPASRDSHTQQASHYGAFANGHKLPHSDIKEDELSPKSQPYRGPIESNQRPLQGLGDLLFIMDAVPATRFKSFDDVVLYYYAGDLGRSGRLHHEQSVSRSQHLDRVIKVLAGLWRV